MAELNTSPPNGPAVHLPDAAIPLLAEQAVASSPASTPQASAPSTKPRPPKGPSFRDLYKQPSPLRVFPFPTLTVSNPLSLVHLAVAWLSHVYSPPPPEPSVVHTAYWDHDTRSLVVTDEKSMLALWQQGFYGKGSLSRSDPNWLKREKIRLGELRGVVSETNTDKRREERNRAKWERARLEQEALEQRRLKEAKALAEAAVAPLPKTQRSAAPLPPVGPLELLALPNSNADLAIHVRKVTLRTLTSPAISSPVGPSELLALPNSHADLVTLLQSHVKESDGSIETTDVSVDGSGSSGNDEAESNTTISSARPGLKRMKSVRFSPDVQSTVFRRNDPPTPPRSRSSSFSKSPVSVPNGSARPKDSQLASRVTAHLSQATAEIAPPVEMPVVNKEHLQLAPEEAFFLAFALGALRVVHSTTQNAIPTRELLTLLRQNSYFPPRVSQPLQPDDPFLIHYAVYHHFRSLGWVPRPGVKFGVDCKSVSLVSIPFASPSPTSATS